MPERARSETPGDRSAAERRVPPASGVGKPAAAPAVAAALALQRAAGNRLARRVIARWAAHPDKDKKGQFMTDEMAGEWNRFNPPLSK